MKMSEIQDIKVINVSRYLKTCYHQDVLINQWKSLETFFLLRHLETFWDISRHLKTSHDISRRRYLPNVLRRLVTLKTSWENPRCLQDIQDVSRHFTSLPMKGWFVYIFKHMQLRLSMISTHYHLLVAPHATYNGSLARQNLQNIASS